MDIGEYRNYVVNTGSEMVEKTWEDIVLDVSFWVQEYLLAFCRNDTTLRLGYINHPLVNSGNAYWINGTTLCLGYKLKKNETIFRPIFSHKRQELINNFQKDISKIVLKRKKCMNYIEFYRIKKLPKDILDYIFELY